MKKLEIIQVRLTGNTKAALVNEIRRFILEGLEPETVKLYVHATVTTDLSIHIHLDSSTDTKQTSNLGLRLAAELREYGMVQHSLWVEAE